MKPIAIIAIIAAVVVVGGACAGVAFSGVLNGGTTGPGGGDVTSPTGPTDPTVPVEPPLPPTETPMSTFSPMTSSGSSSSSSSNSGSSSGDDETEEECSHAETKLKLNDDYTHSWVCKKCGVTVTTDSCTYTHYQYAGKSDDGKPIHSMICDVCGNSVTGLCEEGRTTHVKADGEYQHSVKCEFCEGPYGDIAECFKGENQDSWTPVAGTSSHTRTCVVCTEPYTVTCTFDAKPTHKEGTKTHTVTGACTICGNAPGTEPVPCILAYTPAANGADGQKQHTPKCEQCEKEYEPEPCTHYTYTENTEADKIGTHKVNCTNCSNIITDAEACVFDEAKTEYYLNSDKPKMIEFCKNCTYKKETYVEAKIGDKCYEHLADALEAVQATETLEIICPGEYAPFTIDDPSVTIKGINTGNAATSTVIKNTATENLKAYADGITLDSLYIDSTAEQTIGWMNSGAIDPYITTNSGKTAQDLTVTNCYMEGNGKEYHAIMYCGNNLEFTGNTVKNFVNGIQAMCDGHPPDEFVITGNTFIDVDYAIGDQFYFGGQTSDNQRGIVTITDNTIDGVSNIVVWDYAQTNGESSAFSKVTITGNNGDITYLLTHFNYKVANEGLTLTPGEGTQEVRNLSRVAFDIPYAENLPYTINKTDGSALDKIDGHSTLTSKITYEGVDKAAVYTIATGDYLLVNTTSNVKYAFTVTDPVPEVQQYVMLDTIVIEDKNDLVAFATMVNAGESCAGVTVKLMNDIDLTGVAWTPISSFAGTFDGNGHTISNMTTNLFGTVSGTVKNLNVDTVTVANTAKNGANGFIGTVDAGGLVDNCKVSDVAITWDAGKGTTDCWGGIINRVNTGATVQNCEISNVTITADNYVKRSGAVFAEVGGKIAGCTVDGVTLNVVNDDKVTGNAYTSQVGGIIADLYDGAEVSDCTFNNVKLTIDDATNTGGIIGKVGVGSGSVVGNTLKNIEVNGLTMNIGNTIQNSWATVTNVGGFIGQVDYRSATAKFQMDNCHINDLDMTLASNKAKEDPSAGFISSLNGNAVITNCSVDGKIDGTNEPIGIGGFLGAVGGYGAPADGYTIEIKDCSADVAITGNDNIFVGGFVGHAGAYAQKINLTLTFTGCTATGYFYGTVAPETNDNGTTETVNFNNCKENGAPLNG